MRARNGKTGISRGIGKKRKTEKYGQSKADNPAAGHNQIARCARKARKSLGTRGSCLFACCLKIGAFLRLFVFSPFAGDRGFFGFTHSR